ncbi:zinc transporter ZntB [Thalassococcus sp. S3]|nr:zinc transporter ZntB [Thalassococcus sp. S3]
MALFAFDIWPDGRAEPARDTALDGPGALRWRHFELNDPALRDWAAAHLPAIPADALVQPETRPRCDIYDDGLILNLRGVNLNPGADVDEMVSLRLWVTAHAIVSVRVRRVFALDDVRERTLAGEAPPDVGAFLALLLQGLAHRTRDVVLDLEAEIERLEDGYELEDTIDHRALKAPRRAVIRLLRYMTPQRDALVNLLELETPLLTAQNHAALREPINLMILATEALQAQKSRLEALHDHADARSANELGRNSYALSIVAAVFLPLGFLTGLFGVNVAGMPGLDWPWAFALLTGALVISGVLSVVLLKWLRLL